MTKNVLWSFSIIGVFIFIDDKKEFVVNPWLVEVIKNDSFNKKYYFDINQELFDVFYRELDYKRKATLLKKINYLIKPLSSN